MPDRVEEISGIRIFARALDGAALKTEHDAVDLISAAASANAEWTLMPIERLDPDFFVLRTRLAGEFLQKFVTYGKRICIVGKIPAEFLQSRALQDFISECNRGRQIWFVESREEFSRRLLNQ